MYEYNMYLQRIPKRKSEAEIQYMINFIIDCINNKRGWIHTLFKGIKVEHVTYRCPTCQSTVHGQHYCWRCKSHLSKSDQVYYKAELFGDHFDNITLDDNLRNYKELRKYLHELYIRGMIISYTLLKRRLRVKWFVRYIPRVITYFETYKYKYCPEGTGYTDTRDIGVPLARYDTDTGERLINKDPYHWLPDWKETQEQEEKAKGVRLHKQGKDMDGKYVSKDQVIKQLSRKFKIKL